ncbi:hypothetical protein P3S67_011100 [Capsicum chacoense]
MVRKTKTGGRGQQTQTRDQPTNNSTKAIPQSADARKTKDVNILQGILPFQVEYGSIGVTIRGESSHSSSATGKAKWGDIVEETTVHQMGNKPNPKSPSPNTWSQIVSRGSTREGFDLQGSDPPSPRVKITIGDVQDESEFWGNAVICYMMGSSPPQSVMEGYFNRIWKGKGVDKIAQVHRGVFLVRFSTHEEKVKVIDEGVVMFDRKPIVVKAWTPDTEVTKETVKTVPV